MKSSTKDNVEGKMHQVKGKIKETVGKAVGNDDLEAEGKVEKLHGKVQEKLGQVEKNIGKQKAESQKIPSLYIQKNQKEVV